MFKCYIEIVDMTCWREIFLKRSYLDVILNEHCYIFPCDRFEEFYQKVRVKRIFNHEKDDQAILKIIGYYDREINATDN